MWISVSNIRHNYNVGLYCSCLLPQKMFKSEYDSAYTEYRIKTFSNRNYRVLMSVCVSVLVSVCLCVCVCVQDNLKNNESNLLKLEHIVVYENSLNEHDIGHCPIKVKVTA